MPHRETTPYKKPQKTHSSSPRRSPRRSHEKTKTPQAPLKKTPKSDNESFLKRREKRRERTPSPSPFDEEEEEEEQATPPPAKTKRTTSPVRKTTSQKSDITDEDVIEYANKLNKVRTQTIVAPKKATLIYVDTDQKAHTVTSLNPTHCTLFSVAKRCEPELKANSIVLLSKDSQKIVSPEHIIASTDDGETIEGYVPKFKFSFYRGKEIVKQGVELYSTDTISELRKAVKIKPYASLFFAPALGGKKIYVPPTESLATLFYKLWELSERKLNVTEKINVFIENEEKHTIIFTEETSKEGESVSEIEVPVCCTYRQLKKILSDKSVISTDGKTLCIGDKPIRNLDEKVSFSGLSDSFNFKEETFQLYCTIFLPNKTPVVKTVTVCGTDTGEKLLKTLLGRHKGFNIFRVYGNKLICDEDYLGDHLSPNICYVRIHASNDTHQHDQQSIYDDGKFITLGTDSDEETDAGDDEEMRDHEYNDEESDDSSSDDDDEEDVIDGKIVDPDEYIEVKVQTEISGNYIDSKFHKDLPLSCVMENLAHDFHLRQREQYKFLFPDQTIVNPSTLIQEEPVSIHFKPNTKIIVALKNHTNYRLLLPTGEIYSREVHNYWTLEQMMTDSIGMKCKELLLRRTNEFIPAESLSSKRVKSVLKDNDIVEVIWD